MYKFSIQYYNKAFKVGHFTTYDLDKATSAIEELKKWFIVTVEVKEII